MHLSELKTIARMSSSKCTKSKDKIKLVIVHLLEFSFEIVKATDERNLNVQFFCRNQSQVTLLSPNQSVLYTWDDPTHERTLMWNVYNRKKPSYPAFISKVIRFRVFPFQNIVFRKAAEFWSPE